MSRHTSLDVAEFRQIVEALCASAAADLRATSLRLDRLRGGADDADLSPSPTSPDGRSGRATHGAS
jgi:hypothetical protein